MKSKIKGRAAQPLIIREYIKQNFSNYQYHVMTSFGRLYIVCCVLCVVRRKLQKTNARLFTDNTQQAIPIFPCGDASIFFRFKSSNIIDKLY
jgi:hypothetical protein